MATIQLCRYSVEAAIRPYAKEWTWLRSSNALFTKTGGRLIWSQAVSSLLTLPLRG